MNNLELKLIESAKNKRSKPVIKAPTQEPSRVLVSTNDDLQAALKAEGYTGRAIQIPDSLVQLAGVRAAMEERKRVTSILKLNKEGFEKVIQSAIEDGQSAEQTAYVILETMQDRGITLEAIKRDSPAPAPRAPQPEVISGWNKAVRNVSAAK